MGAMKKCFAEAAVCAVALVGVVSADGGVAGASPTLSCGATITRNTTLHADLVNCPGDGIVIGAADVTLDLNGHRIDGDAITGTARDDMGVRNDGFEDVTVQGGTVQEFDVGVAVTDGPRNTIRRLVARDNLLGIALFDGSDDSRIEHSRSVTNGVGIFVRGSAGTTVRRNNASTNDFVGILGIEVTHMVIANNTVVGHDLAGDGISVDVNSTDNLITHNSVSAAELPLSVTGDRNTVTHNRVSANRSGLIIVGNDNAAIANVITDAAGCGPGGGCGIGVSVEGGNHNVIARNHVTRTFDSGMRVDAYVGSATATEFTDNTVDRAGTDGIAIGTDHVGPVEQTVVNRNKVTRAVADGIDVDDATATLTGNTTLRNGGFGIDAVTGVIDGGGNDATGNGNPAQCSPNIAC